MSTAEDPNRTPIVAVGGAAGFLGAHMVRGFDARGARVLPLVRVMDDRSAAGALSLESVVDDASALSGVSALVHVASVRARSGSDTTVDRAVNIELVERSMRACARAGVGRFVFVSGVGVYGYPARLPVTEEHPYAPRTPYFGAKVEAELRVKRLARELPIELVIARPALVYGRGDRSGFLDRMAAMMRASAYRVVGSGENALHHIHVDDVVEGLWLAATHPEAAGNDFILAGPETTTLNRLSSLVADAVGRPLARTHVPIAVARAVATALDAAAQTGKAFTTWEAPVTHERLDLLTLPLEFDTAKARLLLGFAPAVGYEDGVMRTLRGHWPALARAGADS